MRGTATNSSTYQNLCVVSTTNYSSAVSPAFDDFEKYNLSSREFSTWTESIWKTMSVRIFLKPSQQRETVTLSVGVIVLLISFVAVYFIEKNVEKLFDNTVISS